MLTRALLLLFAAAAAYAQPGGTTPPGTTRSGPSLPATCSPGPLAVYFKTTATVGLYQCLTANTWTAVPTGSGPTGAAGGKLSGTYPNPGLNAASTDLTDSANLPRLDANNIFTGTQTMGTMLPGNIAGAVWYFAPGKNGAACNGTTDDTAALNALLQTIYNAGGGVIYVKSTCLISGAVVVPNDGGTFPNTRQPAIRITGASDTQSAGLVSPVAPLSVLDLRYNATVAKIDTRAYGKLEIDHISLADGGSDCAAFLHTTNTTLSIHDVSFSGTHTGAASCNDAIVMGGSASAYGNGPQDYFQGYGTIVSGNWFYHIRRAVWAQSDVNGIQIVNNTVDADSGGSNNAAFEFRNDGIKWNNGNYIAGNLIEMGNYKYAIWFSTGQAWGNTLVGNSLFDWDTPNLSGYRFETGAANNLIFDSWNENHGSPFSEGTSGSNTYITANGSPGSVPGTSQFRNSTVFNGYVTVQPQGTVGIGDLPSGMVLLEDAAQNNPLELHVTYAQGISHYGHSNTSYRGPEYTFWRSRGTRSVPVAVNSGDALGAIASAAYNGTAYAQGGGIAFAASQNWTASAQGTNVCFQVTPNNTVDTVNSWCIDQNSNVGVGFGNASDAKTRLDVNGPTRNAAMLVSALPACTASTWDSTHVGKGAKLDVTDALTPTYLVGVVGGGAVYTPVVCNGTAWVSF